MSFKRILASAFLLTSSLLVKADSDGGSGNGYGGQGNQGNQNSQNGQPGTYNGGGNGGGYGNGWGQGNTGTALLQTVSVIETETMMATTTVTEPCATSAVGLATATSAASQPMSSPTGSTDLVQVVHVSDNNGTLAYSPESIVAAPGTLIEFIFYPKNHTVTQSSFAAPCVPIGISTPNATTPDNPGIRSGFVPVAANSTDFMRGIKPSFTMMVNDTKPIWLYCGQAGHCQKGMAMVINQNMSDTVKTLENYKIAAARVPIPGTNMTGSPGGAPPYGSASPAAVTSTSTFTPPSPAITSSVTATPAAITTSSAFVFTSPTTASPSISTFTGAAAAPVAKMRAAAGVVALGVAVLL